MISKPREEEPHPKPIRPVFMRNTEFTYRHNTAAKIGVIVTNLGTPDAPTKKAVRRYLKEFLSDRRVVEIPKALWWLILNGIILNTQPKKSAHAYRTIWDTTHNDSPLRLITKRQAEKLQERLHHLAPQQFVVTYGMRYGNPSLKAAVAELKAQNCRKIVLLPAYPHYAAATVGSACDAFFDALKDWRYMPTPRIIQPYFDHPVYIEALANSVKAYLKTLNFTPEKFVVSYHGIPKFTWAKGDPYPCHCFKTSRLLAEKLNLAPDQIQTTFQSRFGKAEWVKPYTDKTLETLPQQGIKNVAVLTPAFHTDCLETLEEIALGGKEIFLNAGGENYATVPCLNDTTDSINLFATLVAGATADWLK